MTTTIVRAGDEGLLVRVEGADPGSLRALRNLVMKESGVRACIVAEASLLVLAHPVWIGGGSGRERIERAIRDLSGEHDEGEVRRHEIRVDFSPGAGPDLPRLARRVGLDPEAVVERLGSMRLKARYLGFLAGFAYLDGWPEEWTIPRRDEARLRVPRGSFAVAGTMAGFYPDETPGGWNLLGRTDVTLWDPDRDPPNLIEPGDEIVILPSSGLTFELPTRSSHAEARGEISAEVMSPGQRTLIVGAPRYERYRHGIAACGAFDSEALASANMAVGNPPGACALEVALVGPVIRVRQATILSWFGATIAPRIDGREIRDPRQFVASAGEVVEIGALRDGARGVLALQGGLVDRASRHAISPEQIVAGDVLRTYRSSSSVARIRRLGRAERTVIHVRPGPHETAIEVRRAIETRTWTVSSAFDRVGVRLSSGETPPDLPANLPSCGMQFGTVQWHPGGELVVMGPDHPITGGYLQPMTVASAELWKVAQLKPRDGVRFVFEARSGGRRTSPRRQNV